MKAFVKTNNGTFPNVNFFLAWEAFNTMGYSVTCFEEKDIDTLDVSLETPVFAGTTVFRKIIDKLGVKYPPFDCYPEILKPYYGRNLKRSTVGEEKAKWHKNPIPVFVKPVKPKVFIGAVWESLLNLIPLAAVPDDTECYICEPIDILSEYRVYVHDGDILGVKHYYGDWSVAPDVDFVKEVIKNYKPSPVAYGVDIGVKYRYGKYFKPPTPPDPNGVYIENKNSFVIEVNDACNLGNYGLDSIHYGEMLVARWLEIVATPRVDDKINEELKRSEGYTHIKDGRKNAEELYFKKYDNGGCFRDSLVRNEMEDLKVKSMKAFAEESLKTLRESEEPKKETFKIDISRVSDEEIEKYMSDTISKMRKISYVSDEEMKKLGY